MRHLGSVRGRARETILGSVRGTALVLAAAFFCSVPASAQGGVVLTPGGGTGAGGCVNSPENPTALLALVGTAGGVFSYVRARRRERNGK